MSDRGKGLVFVLVASVVLWALILAPLAPLWWPW